jgi:hypothetical protein
LFCPLHWKWYDYNRLSDKLIIVYTLILLLSYKPIRALVFSCFVHSKFFSKKKIVQWNQSKLSRLGTNYYVCNRLVFGLYRLINKDFLNWDFKVQFIQDFSLFRVWFRQVSLYNQTRMMSKCKNIWYQPCLKQNYFNF